MWEEPRPERLTEISGKRGRWGVSTLVWIVALLGLAAILVNTGILDVAGALLQNATQSLRDTAGTGRAAHPTTSMPETSQTQTHGRNVPDVRTGSRAVLQTLAETCRYWTEQNSRAKFEGHRQTACNDMVQYARKNGLPVPSPGGGAPNVSTAVRQPPERAGSTHQVDQCDRFGYGTIQFRQCRAAVKDRLTEWCNGLRNQRTSARGDAYRRINQQAIQVCAEADQYEIVR